MKRRKRTFAAARVSQSGIKRKKKKAISPLSLLMRTPKAMADAAWSLFLVVLVKTATRQQDKRDPQKGHANDDFCGERETGDEDKEQERRSFSLVLFCFPATAVGWDEQPGTTRPPLPLHPGPTVFHNGVPKNNESNRRRRR